MQKNVSGQAIGAQVITAADGTAFTGSVTVSVTGDAGTQATGSVGAGACTHEGNGYHTYAPAQAETNYDLVAFTFTGTGAIPSTVQVYTRFDANTIEVSGTSQTAGDIASLVTTVDGIVDSILVDTAEIGPAGAGLTDLGGFSTAAKAEINAEVDTALTDYDGPTDTEMVAAFTEIKGATWSSSTDTLEAIRDRGDVAWITGSGSSVVVTPVTGAAANIGNGTELRTKSGGDHVVTISGTDANDAVIDFTALGTLTFILEQEQTGDVLVIADGSMTKSSTNVQLTIPAAQNVAYSSYIWAIRQVTGSVFVIGGTLIVEKAAEAD